jgi:alpha-L-fucosidase
MRWLVGLIVVALFALAGVQPHNHAFGQAYTEESAAEHDARMAWWRDARFGMFIHWGVYAVPAGAYKGTEYERIGEWIMHTGEIPVAEYREFAGQFNPVKYDPDFWAELAKEAGMKYIVITAKHHDGFALFPSEATDWDIVDATPYDKDLIGPLAKAARDRGLRFGTYYSQAQDWVHPGGAKARYEVGQGWDPAHDGDFDQYLDAIAVPQVEEILTRYQPDVIWWDTPVQMTPERAAKFLPLLESHPQLIVNDRLSRPLPKPDFLTPEQRIPATGMDADWETCMTMNRTWGYKSFDHDWKSTETLLRNLIDIASKGGNYLVNIGPKADGTIPQESIDRLREIGKWMKVNGESIYGTTASPTSRPAWGRITTKAAGDATTLYLHVFDWPADGRLPVFVDNEPAECYLLADPSRKFEVEREAGENLMVQLTGEGSDPIASVVVLKIKDAPVALQQATPQDEHGEVRLTAVDADVQSQQNTTPRVEGEGRDAHIGYWTEPDAWLRFKFQIATPGEFDVTLSTASRSGGSELQLEVAGQTLTMKVPDSGDYQQFKRAKAGRIKLDQPGVYELDVRPVRDGWHPVNLRSVRLAPVK